MLQLPEGFELTGVSGSTLEQNAEGPGTLTLGLQPQRRHQLVVSLARAGAEGGPLALVSVRGAQREAIEKRLEIMGKLTAYTKQLDMVMYNDAITDMYIEDFVKAHIKGKL